MKVLPIDEINRKNVILHKHDRDILSLLCMNVRLPLAKIAQIVRLSRQSVEYRLQVMQRNHLLAGSRTLINIQRLGYTSYHFFLHVPHAELDQKIIQRCLNHEGVNALIKYSGKWNFEVSIMAPHSLEAKRVFSNLFSGMPFFDYFPCTLLKTMKASVLPFYTLEKKPLLKYLRNDPSFSKQFLLSEKQYPIDHIDREVLYALSEDAQLSLSALGKRLHVSSDTISYRIKKLIQGGCIKEFRPVIDYSALGFSLHALLLRTNDQQEEQEQRFEMFLQKHQRMLWATSIFGTWDYLLYILTERQEEVHTIVEDMKKFFGSSLHSYEILFAYKEYKYSFMAKSMTREVNSNNTWDLWDSHPGRRHPMTKS